jgi:hypothetical protein
LIRLEDGDQLSGLERIDGLAGEADAGDAEPGDADAAEGSGSPDGEAGDAGPPAVGA